MRNLAVDETSRRRHRSQKAVPMNSVLADYFARNISQIFSRKPLSLQLVHDYKKLVEV